MCTVAPGGVLSACGPVDSEGQTTVRGTGSTTTWQLQVENQNWLDAKVYILPDYSAYGHRVIAVPSLSKSSVQLPRRAATFRIQVRFLASKVIWTSQIWGPSEPCLEVIVANYVPSTYILPFF